MAIAPPPAPPGARKTAGQREALRKPQSGSVLFDKRLDLPSDPAPIRKPEVVSAPAPSAPALNPYRWIILVAVLTGAFLELLDTTSVNVALRDMAGNLGATPDEIAWVSTGYILSNVVVLPLTAWLASVFGRRRYLAFSILLFTVASIFCGMSTTLAQLVFWRILQGAGGAALLSTAQTTLREIFPFEQQGMVQALYTVVVVTGPTVGPAFGGWMTDNYSWPWIFFIKSPLGFVAAWLVWRFLSDSPHRQQPGKVDWQGISLLAVGLASLQYVLEEGERYDWFDDGNILRLTVLAVAALTAFVFRELSAANAQPVVNLRVLRHRDLTAGVILLFIGGFGIYGGTFILPLFTQGILGFSPTQSGLMFLPGGLATIVTTILCGRLLNGANPIVRPVPLIVAGMTAFSVAQWQLGHLSVDTGNSDIVVKLILRGAGLGFVLSPITIAALGSLKGIEIAQGSGLTNLARQLGGSFGIALINTYVVDQTAAHRSNMVGDAYFASPSLAARLDAVAHRLVVYGYSPADAHNAAVAAIDHVVQTQSLMLAYNDAFLLIAVAFVLALPAVLLLVKPN